MAEQDKNRKVTQAKKIELDPSKLMTFNDSNSDELDTDELATMIKVGIDKGGPVLSGRK